MSYLAAITESEPTAVVLLVDQSGSMAEPAFWHGRRMTRAAAVSDAINTLLSELIARCRDEYGYRHYYDIAVVGYSGSEVYSLLPTYGDLHFLMPEQLAAHPLAIRETEQTRMLPDGRPVRTVMRKKIWVEPRSEWNTPMTAALRHAHSILKEWCKRHSGRACYPPTVINITDGEATDGTPARVVAAAEKLKALSTEDGCVLLMNVHLDGVAERSVLFPTSEAEVSEDRYARLLYDISSPMPSLFRPEILAMRGEKENGQVFRGMAYNANVTDLVRMMNIGTSTTGLLR